MGQIANQKVVELFFKAKEKIKERKEKNKAIFWDCDGTLVHNNESFKCSLLRAFKEFGYSVAEEEVKRFLREACSWNKPEEDHGDANGEEWWERLLGGMRRFCEEQGVSPADAVSVCNAFRKNVVSYEYEIYPDAKKVLRYFSEKGYKHYIISNNFPELREVFVRLGLDEEIAGYFISASVGYDKPRKEMFDYATAQAGNPEVRYMIGDNPVADYEGGLNAGMKPVLVHKKVEGMVCCEELTDLPDLIKE
ncbi:MAG: HAD family hydrolase [Lachnospiraceae bacterium]|nr:HAD family hydrolase [Lachnospiraceae bacterium]